jgi:glycerol-3-phosphate acyltransferase PlsY
VGKGWGYFTLFLDVLKGLLPVLALRFFFPSETILHVLAALLLLLGHSKSIFLQFTGGKAAATGLGAVIAVVPVPGLICGALAFGLRFLTRYVSVGSIVAAALIAPVAYLYDRLLGQDTPIAYLVFVAVAGLLVIVRHKANIQRLMQGTENRI